MKQHPGILLAAPANTPGIVNAPRLERRRTIFDRFRQIFGVLAVLAAGMAQAAPVTYYFGGQLDYVDSHLSPALAAGNDFNGTFTYESTTADSSPADPNRGYYEPGPAFTVTVNGLPFSIVGGGSGSVAVYNDVFGDDTFSVGSADSAAMGSGINGYLPSSFTIHLNTTVITPSALSSDALPSSELDLALFDFSIFEIYFENQRQLFQLVNIAGPLSYLSLTDPNAATSIPEPGTPALLCLALAATLLVRRQYRTTIVSQSSAF